MSKGHHNLDTSVLRPYLDSTTKYKKHLRSIIPRKDASICNYVEMEYNSGVIKELITLYSHIRNDSYDTVSDALRMWNHKFSKRPLVHAVNFITNYLETQNVDLNSLRDKKATLFLVVDYIRKLINARSRIISSNKLYKGICPRLKITLKFKQDMTLDEIDTLFDNYLTRFNDKSHCETCGLKKLLEDKESEIKDLIDQKDTYKISGVDKSGFNEQIERYQKLSKNISCAKCSSCADLIISLITENPLQLEHTDKSFSYSLDILKKNHRLVEHETSFF